MTTAIAIMSPRRRRNSMNRVAIIDEVGIHEPRLSDAASSGAPMRPERVCTAVTVGSPSSVVTWRNHDSRDAWIAWSRYTETPPSTSTRLISAITSRDVPAEASRTARRATTSALRSPSAVTQELDRTVGIRAVDLERERRALEQLGDRSPDG